MALPVLPKAEAPVGNPAVDGQLPTLLRQGFEGECQAPGKTVPVAPGPLLPGTVAFRDLSATAAGGRKVLSEITTAIPRGALCAVMGPSGSGKTTLIKALCGVTTGLSITGDAAVILDPDRSKAGARSKAPLGYVPQEDKLIPLLTVREAISYSARLRGVEKVTETVRRLIEGNGLQSCADTRIGGGDSGLRGISGGERRRVSLALGLLEEPAVLCADEVTSGLDASSARQIIMLLRQQADSGTTILCSIHQPRQEIFSVFTHLLLVSHGRLVFAGAAECAQQRVEEVTGLICPAFQNAADFIIDVCALDHSSAASWAESTARLELLAETQHEHAARPEEKLAVDNVIDSGASLLVQRPSSCACSSRYLGLGRQVFILTQRALVLMRRDKLQWASAAYQSALFGVVLGAANYQLSTSTYQDITSRISLCYMGPAIVGYNICTANLYLLCQKMPLFDAEWFRDGLYTPAALVISQFLSTLPLTAAAPVLLFFPTYDLAGLYWEDLRAPLGFLLSLVLVRIFCTAISMLYVSLEPTRSFAKISVVANAVGILSAFSGNYLQPLSALPAYLRWFRFFSYDWYSFRLALSSQFSDIELDVGLSGKAVLEQHEVAEEDYIVPTVAMLGLSTAFLMGSIVALSVLKPRPVVVKESKAVPVADDEAKTVLRRGTSFLQPQAVPQDSMASLPLGKLARNMTAALNAAAEGMATPKAHRGVAVGLDSVSLDVEQPRSSDGVRFKRILRDVSASFEPGTLNVVLGPSGAGKSTLLSVISGQVDGTSFSGCRLSGPQLAGSISLGMREATQQELLSNVAVVGQQDFHMPGLTVQEALQYAARLRLPHTPEEYRRKRISKLVASLGLQGCFRTTIGTQGSGGISGGERRRLSVAMACLSKPSVLVLDEPTTGLDALAANQLVNLLSCMARERGLTVITTIHQPRSDLIPLFDSVLLMGPGGRILFSGHPTDLQTHSEASGLKAPECGNILDFAVDVSRIPEQAQAFHETWAKARQGTDEDEVKKCVSVDSTVLYPMQPCPVALAFRVSFVRSIRNLMRQPDMVWPRSSNYVLLGAILVMVYAPLGDDQQSIQSRIGLLFMTLGALFAGTLNNLALFPTERDVFLRESADRLYSALPFFMAYTALEVMMEAVTSVLGGLLVVYATGLEASVQALGTYIFMGFVLQFNGESIGIVLNSLVSNPGFSVNAINAVCTCMQIISGFMASSLPAGVQAFNWASPLHFGASAMAQTQFPIELTFTCEDAAQGFCIHNGEEALSLIGFDAMHSLSFNMGMCLGLSILYRFVSFVLLRRKSMKASAMR